MANRTGAAVPTAEGSEHTRPGRTPMTPSFNLTSHAATRMAERGLTAGDLELAMWIGTEVQGGYLVREKDFHSLEREWKRLRDQARKLVGKRVVVDGDCVTTAYHLSLIHI